MGRYEGVGGKSSESGVPQVAGAEGMWGTAVRPYPYEQEISGLFFDADDRAVHHHADRAPGLPFRAGDLTGEGFLLDVIEIRQGDGA